MFVERPNRHNYIPHANNVFCMAQEIQFTQVQLCAFLEKVSPSLFRCVAAVTLITKKIDAAMDYERLCAGTSIAPTSLRHWSSPNLSLYLFSALPMTCGVPLLIHTSVPRRCACSILVRYIASQMQIPAFPGVVVQTVLDIDK